MYIDVSVLYLIALIFAFILGFLAIYFIFIAMMRDKYIIESQKLQLKLNQAKDLVKNFSDEPQDFLGGLGIDGVMDAFGVPAIFKPIAKGFIDRVTQNPELLQGILKKVGVDINIPSKETNLVTQV